MRHRLHSLLVMACAVLLVGSAACVVWSEQGDAGVGDSTVILPWCETRRRVDGCCTECIVLGRQETLQCHCPPLW